METLLQKALQGVDPAAPDAFWQIFTNLMGLVPWWPLIIFTVICVIVAIVIAWYRGSSYVMAVVWALIIGPAGWLITWHTGKKQGAGSRE